MTFEGLRFRILPSCQINVHCAYDQLVTISTTKNLFDPNSNDIEKSDEDENTSERFRVKMSRIKKFFKGGKIFFNCCEVTTLASFIISGFRDVLEKESRSPRTIYPIVKVRVRFRVKVRVGLSLWFRDWVMVKFRFEFKAIFKIRVMVTVSKYR